MLLAPQDAAERVALEAVAMVLDAQPSTNRVWPGFSLPARSFGIQTAAGLYLFTPGPAPEGFSPRGRTMFRPGPVPGMGSGIAINHSIGNLKVTVIPVSATAERTAQTLYHEAFHGFQQEQSRPRPIAESQSLAITPEQAASIEVERRVLADALRSLTPPTTHLRRALALRRERTAAGGEALATAERFAEWHEGLADYVAHLSIARAMKRSPLVQRQLVARSLTTPLALLGGSPDERLVRGRSYATGAAFAFLLDQLQPDWIEDLGSRSLDEFAADIVNLQPDEIAGLAASVRVRFGYDKLLASKSPPWGGLTVMSDEAFLALGPYRVVIETTPESKHSFSLSTRGGEDEGMHRPIAGLLLLPKPTLFQVNDGPLAATVRARPVRLRGLPADQAQTITVLLQSAPLAGGKPLPLGDHVFPALDLSAEGVTITTTGNVRVTVETDRLTIRRDK